MRDDFGMGVDGSGSAGAERATELLNRMSRGDRSAGEELHSLIHEELSRLARAHLALERPGHSLRPSDLVQEAFLRLFEVEDAAWPSRGHFFKLASGMMRRLLVDHARRRRVRRAAITRVEGPADLASPSLDILAIHEALDELAELDAELAHVVELRYFGGLTVAEVARTLGSPMRTVERRGSVANAWLRDRLER